MITTIVKTDAESLAEIMDQTAVGDSLKLKVIQNWFPSFKTCIDYSCAGYTGMDDAAKLRPEDLAHIRQWVRKQPHLPADIPDDQLKLFLHSCYYKLERTKKAVETFYTVKSGAPEFFDDRNLESPAMKEALEVCRICMLPRKTPRNYSVLLGRLAVYDASRYTLNDLIKLLFMVMDAYLRSQPLTTGLVFVFDMTGVTLAHLARININSVRKYFVYVQEALPVRLKSIHIINVNPVMTHIMAIIRPFIHKQYLPYINLHGPDNLKDLFPTVPQEILPKDYQGDEASVETLCKETTAQVRSCYDWFKQDETLRTDKSKRQDKTDDTFSIQGSFKKLDID